MTWVQARARDLSALANEVHGLVDSLAADDAAKLAKIDALRAQRDELTKMLRECVDLLDGTYGDQDGDDHAERRDDFPGVYKLIDTARAALERVNEGAK